MVVRITNSKCRLRSLPKTSATSNQVPAVLEPIAHDLARLHAKNASALLAFRVKHAMKSLNPPGRLSVTCKAPSHSRNSLDWYPVVSQFESQRPLTKSRVAVLGRGSIPSSPEAPAMRTFLASVSLIAVVAFPAWAGRASPRPNDPSLSRQSRPKAVLAARWSGIRAIANLRLTMPAVTTGALTISNSTPTTRSRARSRSTDTPRRQSKR